MTQPSLAISAGASLESTFLAKPGSQKGEVSDGFSSFLAQATRQVSQLRTTADEKVRGLLAGDGTDVHTAMIASQRADLAFEMALAVRGKAVAVYQQLMGMQF